MNIEKKWYESHKTKCNGVLNETFNMW